MTTTLTIDRETRNVLQDQVRSHMTGRLEGFHESLRCGSRAEVQEERDLIDRICSLLDELEWDDEDVRESYTITVESKFVAWLREQVSQIETTIECDVDGLAAVKAGDADHYFIGHSQQETIEKAEAIIEQDRTVLSVLSGLADRLPPVAEAVA